MLTPMSKTRIRLRALPAALPQNLELRETDEAIQWRYVGAGDDTWQTLVEIDDIASTIEIGTVTTLAPSDPATVTNVGTSRNVILDIGIPAGSDGLVQTVVGGDGIAVDTTDPNNPIVALDTATQASLVPTGGSTGQVLAKASGTDYDVEWASQSFQPLDADLTQLAAAGIGGLTGLMPTLSNSTLDDNNDIVISPGIAIDVVSNKFIVIPSALTKRLDASWAAGDNQGGLDADSKANSTGYHAWAIGRSDNGATDVLFSTSATGPTMPSADWDIKARLGAFLTDGSGNIRAFVQTGGYFELTAPFTFSAGDITNATPLLKTIGIPLGVKLLVDMFSSCTASSAGYVSVFDPDLGASTSSTAFARYYQPASTIVGQGFKVWSNASGQIYMRGSHSTTTTTTTVIRGWFDARDRGIF